MLQSDLVEIRPGLFASYSNRTCADGCWYAREDVCRCACSGANHGILRGSNADGEQPTRTRRVGNDRYELVAVIPGGRSARQYVQTLYENAGERAPFSESIKPSWGPSPHWAIAGATSAQVARWPELATYQGWERRGECYAASEPYRPYLIWGKQS